LSLLASVVVSAAMALSVGETEAKFYGGPF